MANQIKAPINYPIIAGGKIVSGGSVIFGQPNVKPDPDNPSTLKAVYLDAALTQQAENPQGISSDGVFDQSDTGILYGPSDTVYSIVILGANKKQLSYIPEYDLSDANAAAAAQDSAAQAESAASNAIAAKDLTEALYTDFTNRYFGSYSSDPSVDDLGNPPSEGSIYFNTVSDVFLTWDGSTWANYFPSNPNGLMVTATGTTTPRSLADWTEKEILSYNSIAEVKVDLNLEVGRRIKTYGYYSAGDGGGAKYIISNGAADDGGLYHQLDNGLQAALIVEGPINVRQFGAIGGGINETVIISNLDAIVNIEVDLSGLTILTDILPINNKWFNGYIKHSIDDYVYEANERQEYKIGNTNIIVGSGAASNMPKWVKNKGTLKAYNVEAIGEGALSSNINGRNNTAIGKNAMFSLENGRYNVAIGLESQYYCNSDDGAALHGTRNTSNGSNSLRFNVTGYSNCAMGRNAGQSITNANFNVSFGASSMSGYAPLALDGLTIENQTPITEGSQTFVGTNAGYQSNSEGNVGIGFDSARFVNISQVVALGFESARTIDLDKFVDGREKLFVSLSGTYSWAANTISCTVNSHNLNTGDLVLASIDGEEANYLEVSVTGVNTFTITTPYIDNKSGAITISEQILTTLATATTGVIAIGRRALKEAKNCDNNIAIGETALIVSESVNNTAIGGLSLTANTTGNKNTANGYSSLRSNTSGVNNTAIGEFAASNTTTANEVTALGRSALRNNTSGGAMDGYNNVTGVGAETRVSGSNQVQLGNSSTTTYAFGAIQDRSDARDKTDVKPISEELISFFMDVEWRTYRLDYRDDYIEVSEDGNVTKLEKDGSKARGRHHIGAIAQQVEEAMKKHGVDFAGLQHHSVSGGLDIYTIGYQEFIGLQGEVIQRQAKDIAMIKEHLGL